MENRIMVIGSCIFHFSDGLLMCCRSETLEAELGLARGRDHDDTANLEKIIEQVEDNLKRTTVNCYSLFKFKVFSLSLYILQTDFDVIFLLAFDIMSLRNYRRTIFQNMNIIYSEVSIICVYEN